MKKTKSRSEVVLDKERARCVLGALYESYRHEKKLFQHVSRETHAPQQKYFPVGVSKGSAEHCRWLFFATMTDRREDSDRQYASHERLSQKAPELYTRDVIKMAPQEILGLLKSEKVGSPGQSARYWPRCAETLFEYFAGNPLHLYQEGGGRINGLLDFKRSKQGDRLPGFGPKILSLLSLFYEELGLLRMPEDAFPVDVHVQRFAISTGIMKSSGIVTNEVAERMLRPFLCRVVYEEGWSALELSHAIWFLGSRLCKGCYRSSVSKLLCPVYDQCGGSISTTMYFRKGLWDFSADRHRKGGSSDFALPNSSPLFLQGAG